MPLRRQRGATEPCKLTQIKHMAWRRLLITSATEPDAPTTQAISTGRCPACRRSSLLGATTSQKASTRCSMRSLKILTVLSLFGLRHMHSALSQTGQSKSPPPAVMCLVVLIPLFPELSWKAVDTLGESLSAAWSLQCGLSYVTRQSWFAKHHCLQQPYPSRQSSTVNLSSFKP